MYFELKYYITLLFCNTNKSHSL